MIMSSKSIQRCTCALSITADGNDDAIIIPGSGGCFEDHGRETYGKLASREAPHINQDQADGSTVMAGWNEADSGRTMEDAREADGGWRGRRGT